MTLKQMRWTALALGMALCPVEGQGAARWRYWTVADGLTESFSRVVNRGSNGEIWVRHGTVAKLSVLNGRGVRQIADPWVKSLDSKPRQRRVWPDGAGGAWVVENLGLMRLDGDRWKTEWQGSQSDAPLDMTLYGRGRLVVLFEGRVEMYEVAAKRWVKLRDAQQGKIGRYREITAGFGGEVWIAGTEGIGRLSGKAEWAEWNTGGMGLKDLDHMQPGGGGELFVSGEMHDGKERGTILWRDGKLKIVAKGLSSEGFGWRGPEDSIWLLDGRRLYLVAGGKKEEVRRQGRLSSEIYSVLTEPDGGFWLGTVDGLAHMKAGLWQTPAGAADVREIVHDILEDRKGRLWFAATEKLVKLEGEKWTQYQMPGGMPTHNLLSRALAEMQDGKLLIKIKEQMQGDRVAVFDTVAETFAELKMDGGRAIQFFRGRRDGTLLVKSMPGFRLDIFDGKKFRMLADLSSVWHGGSLKDAEELDNGQIWLAGSLGGGVLEGGEYKEFRPEHYAGEDGFFSLLRKVGGGMLLGGRKSLQEYVGEKWLARRMKLDRVRSMSYDRTGRLWMATSAGVLRIEGGQLIRNGEADGLPSDMASKIFEDSKGRLWVGTTQGISQYHGETDMEGPQTRLLRPQNPPVATAGGAIRLEFAGLDKWKQTEQEHLLYSHRLDEGAWSEYAEGAEANFEGLAAGEHQLEMKAMDRSGNVEETPDTMRFGVPMPWYREDGFFMVAVGGGVAIVSLLGVAAMIYRQRGELVKELERAREAAVAASRQKSIFLANMSHEIRTPMNAILGMSQLALETGAGAEQQEYLGLVTSSATDLLNLLNDILDLSKVEAGKMELVEGNFDLYGCVEGVARTLELKAREKGLEIKIEIAAGTRRYVVGDEHRLRQVLLNLIGNALKFSEHGEVRIEMGEAAGNAMAFVVRDQGEGIAAGQQARIFEPFVQADESATRKHGGTGLGLAITNELVRKMGGKMRVESPWRKSALEEPVEGSAMHFTVELGQGSELVPKRAVEGAGKILPMRVLVAEDNAVNQKLIDLLLRRDGHTVTLAWNGREAVDVLNRTTIDVVLMDVQMPEMDGLEATRLIRAREEGTGKRMPIVAITANALDGDREKCIEAGMDDYLTKPLRLADLRRVVSLQNIVN